MFNIIQMSKSHETQMHCGRIAFHSMNILNTFHYSENRIEAERVFGVFQLRACVLKQFMQISIIPSWLLHRWNWEVGMHNSSNNGIMFCHSCITPFYELHTMAMEFRFGAVQELRSLCAGCCTSLTMQINLVITKLPKIFQPFELKIIW